MDLSLGVGSGSGDEQNTASSHQTRKTRFAHRHSPMQIQRLEEFYMKCPHPDEDQRKDLSKKLGLELKQIKFWFQNKRTQTKTLNERMDNNVLRAENERIQTENSAIKEVLKNVTCPACGGPSYEQHRLTMQKLLQENSYLKQEYEKATKIAADYAAKPLIIQKNFLTLGMPSSSSSSSEQQGMSMSGGGGRDDSMLLPKQGSNRAVMWETAISAMEELTWLVRVDEPLWIRCEAASEVDPHAFFYIPNPKTYERIFPRAHHLRKKLADARVECSKSSSVIHLPPLQLVSMFLDSDKWANLFPTIVGKARTVREIEAGMPGTRNGALQLMYGKLHMLTPMVPPREYVFLRYCYQPDKVTWLISDVSFVPLEDIGITYSSSCYKLPSGCMLQELPHGFSKVTWVEHVEVERESLIVHMLYRNLLFSRVAYGAQRWLVALERMCERIGGYTLSSRMIPDLEEAAPVMSVPEGRRSVMRLGHRMVKSFCGVISLKCNFGGNGGGGSGGDDYFAEVSEENEIGIRVFVRRNFQRGEPHGTTLTAAAPLWLPIPPSQVFKYLTDVTRRFQWDILCNKNTDKEAVRISTGTHPGNYISIIQAENESESVAIIQETFVEPMGWVVVYAPLDKVAMEAVMKGQDSAAVMILPSGFIITGDDTGGSRLTITLQILVSKTVEMRGLSMDNVATVNRFVGSTLNKIKFAVMNY